MQSDTENMTSSDYVLEGGVTPLQIYGATDSLQGVSVQVPTCVTGSSRCTISSTSTGGDSSQTGGGGETGGGGSGGGGRRASPQTAGPSDSAESHDAAPAAPTAPSAVTTATPSDASGAARARTQVLQSSRTVSLAVRGDVVGAWISPTPSAPGEAAPVRGPSPLLASLLSGQSGSHSYALAGVSILEVAVLARLGWMAHTSKLYETIPAFASAAFLRSRRRIMAQLSPDFS
jgi:hypothetical protein